MRRPLKIKKSEKRGFNRRNGAVETSFLLVPDKDLEYCCTWGGEVTGTTHTLRGGAPRQFRLANAPPTSTALEIMVTLEGEGGKTL